MAVIQVPKTPRKAFDRDRKPSDLLLKQIEHLEWAALPAAQRKPGELPTRKVKTEAQAAERVAQLTAMVLAAHNAAPPVVPGVFRRVRLPPIPPAGRSGSKAGSKPATKAAARLARAARRTKRTVTHAMTARRGRGRRRG